MSSSAVLYGSRVTLYRQALNGYVVSTSTAEAPVGLMEHDPANGKRLPFEQALFVVKTGDPAGDRAANRRTGDVVKYGQTICLEHHARQQPLCCHTEQHAIGLKGNLRVLLERKGDSTLKVDRWRVMPRYRLRVEGEPVLDGDPVLLQSVGGDQFLNSADGVDDDMAADSNTIEVSCGAEMQGFQMRVYDGDVGPKFSEATLRCGDCITLFHTEERKFVNADLTSKRCLLKAPETQDTAPSEEANAGNGSGAATRADGPGGVAGPGQGGGGSSRSRDDRAPLTTRRLTSSEDISYLTLFILENADPSRGGAVRTRGRTLFRLKSMATGLYLRTGTDHVPDTLDASPAGTLAGEPGSPASPVKDFAPFPTEAAPDSQAPPDSEAGVDGKDDDAATEANDDATAAKKPEPTRAAKHGLRNAAYQLTLTNDSTATGTLFRLQSASASSSEFLLSGSHIFVEAPSTDNGRLFLVAGGPVASTDASAQLTVGSLSQQANTASTVTLYGRPIKSMRDGLVVRRLRPKLLQELSVIRSYIPPLERYAFNMLRGVGDPYRLREVKENLHHLIRLCELSAKNGVEQSSDGLAARQNISGGMVDVVWQSKLFHQGVPALVLQVIYATLKCPYVNPQLLYTTEMVSAPASSSASPLTPLRGKGRPDGSTRTRFVPVRYTELAELVDGCFAFLAMLVSGRPQFAQALLPYGDFIMNCSGFVPQALHCLASFYANNAIYVELPAAKPRLDQFLRLLTTRPRDPAVLEIIRLFAQCGEESMVDAQKTILGFLSDATVAASVLCPLVLEPPQSVLDTIFLDVDGTPAGSPIRANSTAAAPLPRTATWQSGAGGTGSVATVSVGAQRGAAREEEARRWQQVLAGNEPILLVGLPNSLFVQSTGSEAVSITVSTQYRGAPNVLGRILQGAADLESADGLTWFPLEGLQLVTEEWPEVADVFLPYFTEQIRLLAALASGRHSAARDELVAAWAPPEVLLAALKSVSLPAALHAALTDLFTNTQIDVAGGMQLQENIRNIRRVVSDGATSESTDKSIVRALVRRNPPPCFADAKAYVFRFFGRTAISSDDDVALEFAAALRLTDALLSGGAFDFSEYERLATLLTNVLDPTTDNAMFYIHTKSVHDSKAHALRLLNTMMDVLLAYRASGLVEDFREARDPPYVSQLFQLTPKAPPYEDERRRLTAGGSGSSCCACVGTQCSGSAGCCAAATNCLRRCFGLPTVATRGDGDDEEEVATFESGARLLRVLMQLANTTKSSRLRALAIFFFFRLTSGPQELHRVASRVQLLTSSASEAFFATVNRLSARLASLMGRSFRRSNTIAAANELLDSLEKFLARDVDNGEPPHEAFGDKDQVVREKLTMVRRVGLHTGLLQLVQRLPLPLTDTTRAVIDRVFALITRMQRDPHVAAELRLAIDLVSPLASQQTSLLRVLRVLFLEPSLAASSVDATTTIPKSIIGDVVHCLGTKDSLIDGATFLTAYLAHRLSYDQQIVWRSVVSDAQAAQVVQFRHHWCGPQGQRMRETVLTGREAYSPNGRLARHRAVCALLHAITVGNDLVKPEEVRHEVFGLNSIDALLEVASDGLLPAFFRQQYLPLVKTLILADATAVPVLVAHRLFPTFLRTCALDVARYLQLMIGRCDLPDLEEDLSRQEELALVAPPSNDAEAAVDRSRFGLETYEALVTGPLCECLKRICATFASSVERINSRMRSQLVTAINEVVGVMCDVVSWALDPQADAAARQASAGPEKNLDLGATLSPSGASPSTARMTKPHWSVESLSRVAECLAVARSERFYGNARWRGDAFLTLCELAQSAFESAGGVAALNATGGGSLSHLAGEKPQPAVDGGRVNSSQSDDDNDDKSDDDSRVEETLSTRWHRYLHDAVASAPGSQPDNVYTAAAGTLLRTGDYGMLFLQTLLCMLPTFGAPHATRVLQLLRQLVRLTPADPLDDSVCLPFEQLTFELRRIQVTTPMAARQAFLARWQGDPSLEFPLSVIGLVTEYVGSGYWTVRRAALRAAVALLEGGHRTMQESYYTHCIRTSDEQLFFVLRNHMAAFAEELHTYSFALQRGAKPSEAACFLESRTDVILELRLLQRLCAGQFAPIQTYLASQPDNTISVNLIESLVELLGTAPNTADEVTFTFYQQLIATITETLQGPCRVNQDTIVAYRAADFLTQLFAPRFEPPHPKALLTAYAHQPPRHPRDARHRRRDAEKAAQRTARRERQQRKVAHRGGARGDATSTAVVVASDEGDVRTNALLLATSANRPLAAVRRDCLTYLQGTALACLLALLEGRQDPRYAQKLLATVDLTLLAECMDASADAYELLHGSVERPQSKGFASGDVTNSLRTLKRYFRDFFHNDFPNGREELEDELALAISIYTFFRACFDMQHLARTDMAHHSGGGAGSDATTSGGGAVQRVGPAGAVDDYVDKRGRSVRSVLRRTRHYLALHSKVAKVEIVRDGALERVYFRVLGASVDNLGAERHEEMIRNAVRTSDNERIQHFFHRASEVIVEMNVYSRLRSHCVLYFLNYFSRELILLVLCIVIAVNLMMVIGLRQPTSPYRADYGDDDILTSINALGIALIAVQGVLVVQALFGPATITVTTRWQGWRSRREEKILARARKDIAGDVAEYLAADKKLRSRPWYEFVGRSFFYLVTDVTLVQQLFFLAVAILGFVHNHIWYSIQLLQISLWTPSLNNLFRALAANFSSLLLTFVLLLIVIFIFAIISFFKFSQLFDPLGTRGNGFNCYTLSQCWLVHIDTLRNSGGVGDVAEWPVFYSKDGFGYWFTFFRLAYYVVAVLVVTNLFLGVIVDSLARFRMEQEFVLVDQTKKCFICGQERNVFDVVQPGAYDTHIGEEHNMWQYIYFLHYLSKKDPATFTGQEAYVYNLVQLRDVTFFPIGKSLVLAALTNNCDDENSASAAEVLRVAAEEERQATVDAFDSSLRKAVDPVNKKLDDTEDVLARMMTTLLQLQQMQNHLANQTPSLSTSSSGSLGFFGAAAAGSFLGEEDDDAAEAGANGQPSATTRSVNSSIPYGGPRDDASAPQ